MNPTVQIIGAILVVVTVIETTEAWRDGRKWRQRRIAHVFGKRNGPDPNIDLPPLNGAESNIDLPSLNSANSDILRSYMLSRNDQFSALDQDEKSKEDYDQKYTTDADHIPQSVIDRLAYLDVLRRLRPSDTAMLNYWGDIKGYLEMNKNSEEEIRLSPRTIGDTNNRSITKTRPCNIQRFFTAEKMTIFSLILLTIFLFLLKT